MTSTTDRIQKRVVLRASLERVWRAISDAKQFGTWFGMQLDGDFVAGQPIKGRIACTKVDAEVAKMQEPYVGMDCTLFVERIDPMRVFAFRWHPGASEHTGDPTTLVEFELSPVADGVQLTITESGFDQIPLERRAEAFSGNEQGWEMQTKLIGKFLAHEA